MNTWIKGLPTESGRYWFYGFRYGRISCGSAQERELVPLKVIANSNGVMIQGNGQFVFRSEVEDAQFCKMDLPELPEIDLSNDLRILHELRAKGVNNST